MSNALARTWEFFDRAIKTTSDRLAIISRLAMFFLMLLMTTEVIMRYFFSRPILGARELIEFLGAIFVSTGLAYCGANKGHVDVDVVVALLPERVQNVLGTLTGLLAFFMWALVSWRLFVHTVEMYNSPLMSPGLQIPLYPFVGIVGIGCTMLTLVILAETIERLIKAVKP